ncbi:gag-pol polyprotein [Cucumis melo var. makuwa]|uniref:Gag-pol polyprotein n=1 Tax=Cucumis melo var. makuwa TaxID=1194695 RepID=A0A5D3DVN4_CUCMM|nr:gag-pol polyprotein [Cucumis melo var. makuwa]TYK27572.1 gag-pol polyprotein [Cucumis melo var. makuwa]
MSEDEFVAEYNERVLEIANKSFNLGEKIPESKIVQKVLRSLPGKFDMKVTTIEETRDITKLKLDELFGSLLTFEMAISNRENKNGKGVAFKSVYEEESTDSKSPSEAKCPTFLRKQKKNFRATLSDEDTNDSEEDDGGLRSPTGPPVWHGYRYDSSDSTRSSQPDCLSVSSGYATDQFVLGVPLGHRRPDFVPMGVHVARVWERANYWAGAKVRARASWRATISDRGEP